MAINVVDKILALPDGIWESTIDKITGVSSFRLTGTRTRVDLFEGRDLVDDRHTIRMILSNDPHNSWWKQHVFPFDSIEVRDAMLERLRMSFPDTQQRNDLLIHLMILASL